MPSLSHIHTHTDTRRTQISNIIRQPRSNVPPVFRLIVLCLRAFRKGYWHWQMPSQPPELSSGCNDDWKYYIYPDPFCWTWRLLKTGLLTANNYIATLMFDWYFVAHEFPSFQIRTLSNKETEHSGHLTNRQCVLFANRQNDRHSIFFATDDGCDLKRLWESYLLIVS